MTDKVIPLHSDVRRGSKVIHPRRFEEVPPPPAWLSERASLLWRRVAKELHERATLTVLDAPDLAMYCTIVADVRSDDPEAKEKWAIADEIAAGLELPPPKRRGSS